MIHAGASSVPPKEKPGEGAGLWRPGKEGLHRGRQSLRPVFVVQTGPFINLTLGVILRDATTLLNAPGELVALAGYNVQIVVRE